MSEEKKVDRFAAARAAKAAKKAQQLQSTGIAVIEKDVQDVQGSIDQMSVEEQVWFSGLLAAMQIREAKSKSDVTVCTIVADAVVEEFNKKFSA